MTRFDTFTSGITVLMRMEQQTRTMTVRVAHAARTEGGDARHVISV
jgi:hypothetical protein